jgi:hypothetical protein
MATSGTTISSGTPGGVLLSRDPPDDGLEDSDMLPHFEGATGADQPPEHGRSTMMI